MAMGAGPAHALYFTTYEQLKKSIGKATALPDTHLAVSGTRSPHVGAWPIFLGALCGHVPLCQRGAAHKILILPT